MLKKHFGIVVNPMLSEDLELGDVAPNTRVFFPNDAENGGK